MQKEKLMRKLIGNTICVLLALLLILALVSCEGPQGLPGADGTNGGDGADGNANVTLYIFDGNDFSFASNYSINLDGVSESEYEDSTWLVYLTTTSKLNYPVPGHGYNGLSLYRAYNSWNSFNESPQIQIKRVEGPGEEYESVKIIQVIVSDIIDNQTPTALLLLAPAVDFNDYNATLDYFGLEE